MRHAEPASGVNVKVTLVVGRPKTGSVPSERGSAVALARIGSGALTAQAPFAGAPIAAIGTVRELPSWPVKRTATRNACVAVPAVRCAKSRSVGSVRPTHAAGDLAPPPDTASERRAPPPPRRAEERPVPGPA